MEQSYSRKAHSHIVLVAGLDNIIVPYRAAGLSDIFHARFFRSFDIVAEGEERIRAERDIIIL